MSSRGERWIRRGPGTVPPRLSEREDSAAPNPGLSELGQRLLSPAPRQPHLLTC